MDFFEVVLLAKKEAEMLGRPVEQQLLKYLIVRAAQALHNKYWKELNRWLTDLSIHESQLFKLYQDHVINEHEVNMDQRYNGANPEGNQFAMSLYAKLHKKDNSRPLGLNVAIGEANVAIASYKDFCRNPLCCGNQNRETYN